MTPTGSSPLDCSTRSCFQPFPTCTTWPLRAGVHQNQLRAELAAIQGPAGPSDQLEDAPRQSALAVPWKWETIATFSLQDLSYLSFRSRQLQELTEFFNRKTHRFHGIGTWAVDPFFLPWEDREPHDHRKTSREMTARFIEQIGSYYRTLLVSAAGDLVWQLGPKT